MRLFASRASVRRWFSLKMFEYLEDDMSLDKFLECFPTVRREDAVAVLEHSKTELLAEARA